jgi:hypothetical protein
MGLNDKGQFTRNSLEPRIPNEYYPTESLQKGNQMYINDMCMFAAKFRMSELQPEELTITPRNKIIVSISSDDDDYGGGKSKRNKSKRRRNTKKKPNKLKKRRQSFKRQSLKKKRISRKR